MNITENLNYSLPTLVDSGATLDMPKNSNPSVFLEKRYYPIYMDHEKLVFQINDGQGFLDPYSTVIEFDVEFYNEGFYKVDNSFFNIFSCLKISIDGKDVEIIENMDKIMTIISDINLTEDNRGNLEHLGFAKTNNKDSIYNGSNSYTHFYKKEDNRLEEFSKCYNKYLKTHVENGIPYTRKIKNEESFKKLRIKLPLSSQILGILNPSNKVIPLFLCRIIEITLTVNNKAFRYMPVFNSCLPGISKESIQKLVCTSLVDELLKYDFIFKSFLNLDSFKDRIEFVYEVFNEYFFGIEVQRNKVLKDVYQNLTLLDYQTIMNGDDIRMSQVRNELDLATKLFDMSRIFSQLDVSNLIIKMFSYEKEQLYKFVEKYYLEIHSLINAEYSGMNNNRKREYVNSIKNAVIRREENDVKNKNTLFCINKDNVYLTTRQLFFECSLHNIIKNRTPNYRIRTKMYYSRKLALNNKNECNDSILLSFPFSSINFMGMSFYKNIAAEDFYSNANFRFSNNIASFQIAVNNILYPELPIVGNSGNDVGELSNIEFVYGIKKANEMKLDEETGVINEKNFALNIDLSNGEYIENYLPNDLIYNFELGGELVGKAVYLINTRHGQQNENELIGTNCKNMGDVVYKIQHYREIYVQYKNQSLFQLIFCNYDVEVELNRDVPQIIN